MENFDRGNFIAELIDLVAEGKVSLNNAKRIAYEIIDGTCFPPLYLAKKFDFLIDTSGVIDYDKVLDEVVQDNRDLVLKIQKTRKEGLIQHLVGLVMKKLKGSGDPQKVQHTVRTNLGIRPD